MASTKSETGDQSDSVDERGRKRPQNYAIEDPSDDDSNGSRPPANEHKDENYASETAHNMKTGEANFFHCGVVLFRGYMPGILGICIFIQGKWKWF